MPILRRFAVSRVSAALFITVFILLIMPGMAPLAADDFTQIPMQPGKAATFYITAHLPGVGQVPLMVDTGAGFTTINEQTLAALRSRGLATYLRHLQGILADGSERLVPLYAIRALGLGDACWLEDVEVAVFPGTTRQILGLSALRQTAPFVFSVNPPRLGLSQCRTEPPAAQAAILSMRAKPTEPGFEWE